MVQLSVYQREAASPTSPSAGVYNLTRALLSWAPPAETAVTHVTQVCPTGGTTLDSMGRGRTLGAFPGTKQTPERRNLVVTS